MTETLINPIAFAVLVGVAVYIALVALIPKRYMKGSTDYTRSKLQELERAELWQEAEHQDHTPVLQEYQGPLPFMAKVFMALPGAKSTYPGFLKAGLEQRIGVVFTACLALFIVGIFALQSLGWGVAVVMSAILSLVLGWHYVRQRVARRNDVFVQYFPDALDMLVRSVRSGYPIHSAIRMIVDNMPAPISTEFRQVAEEVAYGSTLVDALTRLAARIDEPDVHFFVVVLSVQQEIGGSLAEILQNLSSIIRKRKHLRMKIKALSSEGRATAWVLGLLPVAEAAIVQAVSPGHMTPLFTTTTGHIILTITIVIIGLGIMVIKQMVNIRI